MEAGAELQTPSENTSDKVVSAAFAAEAHHPAESTSLHVAFAVDDNKGMVAAVAATPQEARDKAAETFVMAEV